MKNLTVQQLKDACKGNRFLLLRFASGYQMGVNCKIAPLGLKKWKPKNSDKTDFVSYLPCDFQTYITKKHSFLTKV